MRLVRKTRVFWPLLLVVFLSDCNTKRVAVEALGSPGSSREVIGETVRFTLVYNEGAAMGLVGSWAKELLGPLEPRGGGGAVRPAPCDPQPTTHAVRSAAAESTVFVAPSAVQPTHRGATR